MDNYRVDERKNLAIWGRLGLGNAARAFSGFVICCRLLGTSFYIVVFYLSYWIVVSWVVFGLELLSAFS